MALPENRIKKVKLPNNTEYEIIPEKISDGSGNYATLPNLDNDSGKVAVNNIDNNFTATQTFESIRTNNSELAIYAHDTVDTGEDVDVAYFDVNTDADDNYIGTSVVTTGYFTAFGDNDNANTNKPDDETEFGDLDTDYFNTGITLRDSGNAGNYYTLSFPAKSGIFATTTDLTEIVDLTQLNDESGD